MKTQAEAVNIALSAVGQRKTTAHGFTNPYGAQCVAFTAWQDDQAGGQTRIMPGYNAIDVYNKNPLGYAKIAPRAAKPGDYHFMNYESGGINYGHTGVVVEVVTTGVWSVDENWYNPSLYVGSPAARVFHPFAALVGLLRPPYGGIDMADIINDGDAYFIAAMAGLREIDVKNLGVPGKTWKDGMYYLFNTPEYKNSGLAAQYQLLVNDRDANLYPYINAVTNALGIPNTAQIKPTTDAIDKLKAGGGTPTVLKPGIYEVK